MSDFAQPGSICTLQVLAPNPALEPELAGFTAAAPLTLLLPCHASELRRPALAHLLAELKEAPWISRIVVALNGLTEASAEEARALFRALPQPVHLLWTDRPGAQAALAELLDEPPAPGKGLNIWAALGHPACAGSALVATQDCDVISFRRANLARLCAPCVHPRLRFAFAKMYYSRVTDRLYGRVSRLFFAPLLQAVLRVAGHQPLLDFLLAFRYPLAGECALHYSLARELPCDPGWGLETAMLCEVFRRIEPGEVCQVDGGPGYDHKHQPADVGGALPRMSGEIARALLAQLAQEGCATDARFRVALRAAYLKEGETALRRSEALSLMNGLPHDAEAERALMQAFAGTLDAPGAARPALPPWSRLARESPEAMARFYTAAALDGSSP